MNIDDLFKGTGTQKSHSSWRVLVDSEDFNKMELCNKLYSMFKPFSDNDFKKKFEIEFYSAFWEMDLACTLIESGFHLSDEFSGNEGPDLCLINSKGNRIWVEAVCVNRGTSSDEVSLGKSGQVMRIDSEKIMLRLTSAIFDKDKKHKHYLNKGICAENEPFIIAVNGSLLTPGPGLDDMTPRIVKAVFEGGHDEILFDRATGTAYEERQIDYRPTILKHNKEEIFTNYFRRNDYTNISALLFSESSLWSRPSELGSDYVTVHNPIAVNPIAEGFFQLGSEYIEKKNRNDSVYLDIKNYRKLEYLYE